MNLNELSLLSINAAIKAGLEIMKIYKSDDFGIVNKSDSSPLTMADTKANKIILDILSSSKIPYISEESITSDYSDRKSWPQCWIIDPLDGTKEFIKRNGEFTVNIALIENHKPVLGVIYVPVTGDLYFGNVLDKKNVVTQTTRPYASFEEFKNDDLFISKTSSLSVIKVVGSKSHMNNDTKDFINDLSVKYPNKNIEVVSKGSSLKFCLVATGKADIYPRFAPTMEWDTAAGQAICEAAGFKVIDQKTQKPMVYNREELLNSYFLVSKI